MRMILLLVVASVFAGGCTSAVTRTAPATVVSSAAARCAWYTPMTGKALGQIVTITAAGPACRSQALIGWIAGDSDRPWASTSIHPGTVIAQLAKGGTVVQIWQEGFARVTDQTAGALANAFQASGWTPQQPVCGAGGCGPTPTPTTTRPGG
jgi:hypothetical protein